MINLRIGNENDIRNLCILLIDTWKQCYQDFMPAEFLKDLNLEKQIKRHEKYMLGQAKYIIAENSLNEMIGFASYGKNRMEKIDCPMELYTLYVSKSDQGKGVGRLLLNAIMKEINEQESELLVSVFQKNPFVKFYKKNGFIKLEEAIIDLGSFELVGEIYRKSKIVNRFLG